jgi:hypothetical protein
MTYRVSASPPSDEGSVQDRLTVALSAKTYAIENDRFLGAVAAWNGVTLPSTNAFPKKVFANTRTSTVVPFCRPVTVAMRAAAGSSGENTPGGA